MPRGSRSRLLTLLAVAAVVLLACDGSSPTSPTGPAAGPAPRAGDWQGTTGQGRTISFTVGGAAGAPRLTRYEITAVIDDLQQSGGAVICLSHEFTISEEPTNIPIVGGAFSFQAPGLGSRVRVEGRFDSAVSASGTLVAETTAGACIGSGETTWTAAPA